jgi:hypothetical protein
MECSAQLPASEDLHSRRFTVCGTHVSFADLCAKAFRPSDLKPAEYVDLLWDEA